MTLRQMASQLSARVSNKQPKAWREYDSFNKALEDSDSYEDPRLIQLVVEKTKSFREALSKQPVRSINSKQTLQNLFVLSNIDVISPVNVLEIGGACGASYFELSSVIPERIGTWAVVETPAMVTAAKAQSGLSELSFHSDLQKAVGALKRKDILIAQGVVQYSSDPLGMLKSFVELGFSYIYLTRTAIIDDNTNSPRPPIYTRQETQLSAHGPGPAPAGFVDDVSSQPLTIVGLNLLKSAVAQDYELIYWFDESQDQDLNVGGKSIPVRDVGFLARRL